MRDKKPLLKIEKLRSPEKPTALITGGVSGIGRVTAEYLTNKGWCVIVADNDKAGLKSLPDSLLPMYLDVSDAVSINSCVAEIDTITDGLDAIINCAGILVVGSVVEVSEKEIIRILDVNLLGTYRVNRSFLPLVIKRNGRIIVMSSEIGVQTTIPFNGPYAISKHALEAYADALRRELIYLGIKVITIRAGAVRSKMVDEMLVLFQRALASSNHFKNLLSRNIDLINRESNKAINPLVVAEIIYLAITTNRPKVYYSVKFDLRRTLVSRLPASLADFLIRWVLKE